MNFKQMMVAFDVLREAKITPHIIGEAGIGKSAGVYQYADARNMLVVEVRVGLMADSGDLVGIQEFVRCLSTGEALSTRHVLPDWFMKAVVNIQDAAAGGKEVILFFDELTRGHKDLLQACFELVYDRALKGTKVRPGTFIVAASNPTTDDYSGSMEFSDDAFADRFCHIKLEPSLDEFLSYGKGRGKIDVSVLDFIQEYPQMLDKDHKPWSLDFVHPSRRSWDRLSRVLGIIETNSSYKEVELELMFGIVGEKAALAYRTFRETYIKSIKAKEVLERYSVSAEVRDSVAKAIETGRTDMLGTLNEEISVLLGNMKSLTQLQADNLADLSHDLPVEHAFALVIKLTSDVSHSGAIMKVTDPDKSKYLPGESFGLYYHTKFVDRVQYIKAKREEVKKLAKANKEAQEAAPKKKKK